MQREEKDFMHTQMQKTAKKRNRFLQSMAWIPAILTILIFLAALPMNPALAAKTVKETYDWATLYSDGSLTLKNASTGYVDVTAIKNYAKKSEVTEINCASGTKFPEKCNALFRGYENVEIINLKDANFEEGTTSSYMFIQLTRINTVTLPETFRSVTSMTGLNNFDNGWARDDKEGARISGTKTNAEFINNGTHTYYRRKHDKPDKPKNLVGVRPSRIGASDGKITGVNTTMEYRKNGETAWKKCTGTAITGLSAGAYAVRYAETDTRYASDAQTVTVQEGPAKLILDSNGKLTIYGKVQRNDYLNFEEKNKVTSVVAADNAVLPQDCSKIFQYYEKCVSIDLSKTNTANVTNMSYMFDDCKALKSLNLSKFNTANVTDMSYMFSDCSALTSLNVSAFNTYNVTNMRHMFDGCCLLTSLDVSNFNTAKVTDMSYMFENCCALTSLDLSGFSTAKVTDMNSMFDKCKALTSVDVSRFNTAKVTDMSHMFSWCESLESVDVSKFNTSNVTKMSYMFFACNHMTRLDLSSFSINDETDINEMFSASRHIRYLTLGSGIKKIDEKYKLDNGDSGWYCGNEANLISGGGNYAVITNSGKNTYSKVIYLGGNLYIRNVDRPTFGDDIIYGETIKAVPSLQWYMCPEENLAYQWQRDGVNISGATANTYTLVKGDIGKIISCVVTDKTGETPGSIKASTKYAVGKKSGPGSPEGLTAFATSIRGAADGRITGVTTEMEYATNINFRDAKPCTGNVITGLKANMYYIRYAETATTKAGGVTVLQVKEGPASAPTPTAAPDKPATEVFSDIKPTAWYVKAVQYVYEKGIMSGKGSEFQPGMPVTREEFAQTLYNHFGKPQPSVFTGNPFPDVKSGKWYTNAVLWAKEKDIVKGYSNGKFGVGDKITREQLAQMLYKYARIYGYDLSLTAGASTGYKDSNKRSDWAYTALDWAVSQGIINGKGTSGAPKSQLLLDPKGNATRAECAQMMMKLLQNNQ